ncbi:hypothetical protein DSO57_1007100 [Entomophthora muscae]|uniref:Uncharacterized protein n=1 Tax=Entomophthora muscae TaxID=34485 RepID=A0ACC2TUE4_9FUNG|nr:hypothetical protein DSO57_1007100 [Entomophthora muscae]
MEEELMFKTRLSFDERTVKRCIKRFQAYLDANKTSHSSADREYLYNLFELDLAQTELSLSCQKMTSIALDQELEACDLDFEQIEKKVRETEDAIAQYQKTLESERSANSQRVEYNTIIKKIQEYNSRAALENSIIEAKTSIATLEQERELQNKCAQAAKADLQVIVDLVQKFQNFVSDVESSPSAALEKYNVVSNAPKPDAVLIESPLVEGSDCEIAPESIQKSSLASPVWSSPTDTIVAPAPDKASPPKPASPQKRKLESPTIEEGEWTPNKKAHTSNE